MKKERRVELTEAINSSAGMAHINRVHHRTFSLNIFKMNAQELIHAVRHVRDPDYGLQLMAQNNKEAGNHHREINRLVDNFVAASKSLIDHTRVFIDTHYAHTSLAEAYQERITGRFANDPVSKFVQDLRNYMLHKRLPNSAMYIHFSQNPENAEGATLISGVHFSAAELLEWNGWTAPARAYILAAGEYLELPNFAEEYLDKVLELQNWLEWELEQFHATDLAVLGELEKERAGLYDEVEPTLPTRAQVNAVRIARFEFPKDVETFIDTAGQELLSAVTELELSPRSATGFGSERPKVLLTGDEIIEPPVMWGVDNSGQRVLSFTYRAGKVFGLTEKTLSKSSAISGAVLKIGWAAASLSEKFVDEQIVRWCRESFESTQKIPLSQALALSSQREVSSKEIWIPISHLEVEAPFDFGPIRIAPITSEFFDALEGQNPGPPEQRERVSALFRRMRERMQGLAAVLVQVEAEEHRAQQEGLALAQSAVSLLRFFAPYAHGVEVLYPIALLGTEVVPRHEVLLRHAHGLSYAEGIDAKQILEWAIAQKDIQKLRARGFGLAEALAGPEGLSSFAASVRNGLTLYSSGITLTDVRDRLVQTLAALEDLLLIHNLEPAEYTVEQRLGKLLDALGQSEEVMQNVREVYRIRRGRGALVLNPQEESSISTFVSNSHKALRFGVASVSRFSEKSDFVEIIEHAA